jgi:hypothetical protein
MDDITRRIVADAIAQDEFIRRDFDCWEAKRRQQQELERRQAAHDAEQFLVRQWLARTAQVATTDEASSRAWTEWARDIARIEAIKLDNDLVDDLEKFSDALGARIKAHFENLQARIDELEARIEGSDNNKVVPLIPLRGGRRADAA